jgi:diguanylate cyclase (GGDEF)-like protein
LNNLLRFAIRQPWLTLFFLFLIAGSLATQLPNLRFDISAQSMMVRDDPLWLSYQESLKTFGSDNVVIVFLHDDNLFDPRKLDLLDRQLKQIIELEFVKSSSSLFSVPNVVERDGYIVTDAFLKTLPADAEQARTIVDEAVRNPLVANNLISADGKSMAINLSLDGAIHRPGQDQQVSNTLEQLLEPLKQEFSVVFQMSSPYVRSVISQQIQIDQRGILPASLAVLIVILGLSLKSINSALIPLMTSVMSIIATLAIMTMLDIPVNVMSSIIPALLIIVGSTEDVHLIAEYNSGIRSGLSRDEAVDLLPTNQTMAVSLAFLTTFIGFLSISVSELELLREFGLLIAAGLLINFLFTILFVPAWLKLFGAKTLPAQTGPDIYQRIASAIFHIVIRYKTAILLLLVLTLAVFCWGARLLEVNNNTLSYFSPESEINQRARRIHQDLSGMQTFSILLESGIEDTFLKTRYLKEIEKLQQYIEQRDAFDKSFSFADFIKLTHGVMEGSGQLELPDEDEIIGAYMGLVQFDTVKDYVTRDFSQARILVRHNIGSSKLLDQELALMRDYIDNDLKTRLSVSFSGESVLTSRAADAMALGQIQSLLLMVVVIFLLVSLLFIDLRAGLLALAPNVFPVFVLFGVMGYFNIPLDTGTTMVAVIALGICVDDTIHFLSRYHFFTRGAQDVEQALLKTVAHEATPITTTSLALATGFLTLTLSSFQPVVNFGALSALVMLLALFSTFILTPILLSFTKLITVWDMLSLNLKSAVLRRSLIFQGMSAIQIRKAILSGIIRQYEDGEIMIEQGSRGPDMYVILEGHAHVTHKDSDGSVHTLGQLNAGELFGELSLLSNLERSARVTASQHAKVLIIKWQAIRDMERFHPRISMKLFRNLSIMLSRRFIRKNQDNCNYRDELTGALTKPFFLEQLELELERCKRHGEKLSTLLMDIDLPGVDHDDDVLLTEKAIRALTSIILDLSRRVDIFARWQDNRFIMAFPRTAADAASNITERMKITIENTDLPDIGRVHIHAAIIETDGNESMDDLIERTQLALEEMQRKSRTVKTRVTKPVE